MSYVVHLSCNGKFFFASEFKHWKRRRRIRKIIIKCQRVTWRPYNRHCALSRHVGYAPGIAHQLNALGDVVVFACLCPVPLPSALCTHRAVWAMANILRPTLAIHLRTFYPQQTTVHACEECLRRKELDSWNCVNIQSGSGREKLPLIFKNPLNHC